MSRLSGSEYQRDLVAFYLTSLRFKGDTELLDFAFGQGEPERAAMVKIARMCLRCEDGSKLWFAGTLGRVGSSYLIGQDHEHQFIGIFDSDDLALAELIASAYHYDHFVEPLDYGHTFPLPKKSSLRGEGYSSVIVLDGALYRHFETDQALVAGIPTKVFSVVPMSASELKLKKEGGVDALLESWDTERRDILRIGQRARGD